MKAFKVMSIAFSIAMLTACGGGSASSENGENENTNLIAQSIEKALNTATAVVVTNSN